MAVSQARKIEEERKPIEKLSNGNILFRVPRLLRHMTSPDCVKILQWHIKEGDIVSTNGLLVHCEFLEDDWYITMPEMECGPLRVLKIKVVQGQIVHLHDPLVLWEPVSSLAVS